jgi:hypothetical protein
MTRRPELIFRGFHQAVRKQRDLIDATPAYRGALREGICRMQRNWGEQVLWDMIDALHRPAWGRIASDLAFLVQYYPSALFTHAWRKLNRSPTRAA